MKLEFLPEAVRDGLASAHKRQKSSTRLMSVRVGGEVYPILQYWPGGFSLERDGAPNLPGRVDVYEGSEHVSHGLIVAAAEAGNETFYEFKLETRAASGPPRDFAPDDNPAPDGSL